MWLRLNLLDYVLCIVIDLVQSATIFREAAGVYHHLANEVLPTLQLSSLVEKPPEALSSVSTVMNLVCLAEAQVSTLGSHSPFVVFYFIRLTQICSQAVTIKRAEEKGTSISLLAKLHHGIADMLDEAAIVLYAAIGECKDISSRFVVCKRIDNSLFKIIQINSNRKITTFLGGTKEQTFTQILRHIKGHL